MTNVNSIVPQERIQGINSISMVLLSMSDHYDLPDAVRLVIRDLHDEVETLSGFALLNEHVNNLKVVPL